MPNTPSPSQPSAPPTSSTAITYHESIQSLEEVISYGTLGVINTLVNMANDQSLTKRNVLLVNIATIIRNCLDRIQNVQQSVRFNTIMSDLEKLVYYFDHYTVSGAHVILYAHHDTFSTIPPLFRRDVTKSHREEIEKLTVWYTTQLGVSKPNTLHSMSNIQVDGDTKIYLLLISGQPAYRALTSQVFKLAGMTAKIYLVSHNPTDYLILEKYPSMNVILSHTGRILKSTELGPKVFGVPTIPFNRTTLKMFGDSHYRKPMIKNKPKVLNSLGTIKSLNLRSEKEIEAILLKHTNVVPTIYKMYKI